MSGPCGSGGGSDALYARVSSTEQAERQTINTQIDEARRYATLRGLTFAETFLDDGISGTIPLERRPGGAALLAAARAGRITTVYLYRLDRLGRDIRVTHNAIHALAEAGCAVVSVTESFDSTSPSGRAMIGFLAVVSAWERDSIAERVRAGMHRAHAEPARWMGGARPPYGYAVEVRETGSYIVPCEEEARIVRGLFELAAQGWSCIKLADYLNALAVPTAWAGRAVTHYRTGRPYSGRWQPNTVRQILRNTTYKGVRLRRGVEQACPALVDDRTWAAVQAVLVRNRSPRTRPNERIYLLRGLLVCGACGRRYHGWPQTSGYHYYMCHGWRYRPKCAGKLVAAERIEEAVWQEVEAWLRTEEAVDASLAGQAESRRVQEAERAREREVLRARIDAKSGERERVLSLYRRGVITEAELDRQLAEVQAEQALLTERWAALEGEEPEERGLERAELARAVREALGAGPDPLARQEACAALIERIRLTTYPERGRYDLEIVWRV